MAAPRKNPKNKRSLRAKAAHVRTSLAYIAPHKHTGKRLARHHTSHGALFLFLIAAGVILFLSLATLEAAGITQNGHVNVSLTVAGPAPTTGAVINTPLKKSKMKQALATVTGTCPSGNTAAVYNNGLFASSTTCSPQDTFETTVSLRLGANTLQAQNYDSLNQAGPVTEQIEVVYQPEDKTAPLKVNTPDDIVIDPTAAYVAAPQPSDNPCYDPTPPTSNEYLWLTVPCITRNVFLGDKIDLPVYITGGLQPYALSVNWGDSDTPQLFSLQTSGRHMLSHTYMAPQLKQIALYLTDAQRESLQIKTLLEVSDNSVTAVTTQSNPSQNALQSLSAIWVEASVPVYWAAVALFLGFWVGDLFQRLFGTKRPIHRRTA